MSGPIDEEFTEDHLPLTGDVLEFGCSPGVFTTRMAKKYPKLTITGVDINPPEVCEGWTFVQGNVLDYEPGRQFNTICCVSSFEHAGIETTDFRDGTVDVLGHLWVAGKLLSLLAPGGRLIVTCPFGTRWGYRTFTTSVLQSTFRLQVISHSVWALRGGEYFDRANWGLIDEADVADYGAKRRAVLGVVMRKNA